MFIYKIIIKPTQQVYIGLDTKPVYKKSRWKYHCNKSKMNPLTKLHKAMNYYGIDNCEYEVIEENFNSIIELAKAEIRYILEYNSFKNGLNGSCGGDGLNQKNLLNCSENDLKYIRSMLGEKFKIYNKEKWSNKNQDERKELTKHLHNEEVYTKKSNSLKEYYKHNPNEKSKKGVAIKKWSSENIQLVQERNRLNGLKGAIKVSKKLDLEKEDGTMISFNSISEYQRQMSSSIQTLRKKSLEGKFHKGMRIKNV